MKQKDSAMFRKTVMAALAAVVVGTGSLATTVTPAAADSFSFGFTIGDRGGARFVHDDRRYDRHYGRHHDRRHWRGPVKVCEDVWKVRKRYDRHGRLKIVKIRDRDCHWGRR